ncbi:conserved hypothetical pox protein-similar to MOCV144R [Squirrelpox virus]|uniref:C3R n=1 Tax=Squirrelpox virus TaxID=240426 RepID=Q1HTR0_9POXV|nr:conserved hypothetical pox protein-similar to MOCV144R [Squirrelpox virus]ABD51476.1 C3R [Squirrelpox virus]CCD83308.1 conserved hypothetical pox protein-similar to MOCV144R [Squirrelpox virus]
MFKRVNNLSTKVCAFTESLLADDDTDGELESKDVSELIKILDFCLDDASTVEDISDILIVDTKSSHKTFDLRDAVRQHVAKPRLSGEAIIEPNTRVFALCVGGCLQVDCADRRERLAVVVEKGEAFFVDTSADHSLTSGIGGVRLVVLVCTVSSPFIHYGDVIISSSSVIYSRVSGYSFALFRISNDADAVEKDVIISCGRIYDAATKTEMDISHLRQLLRQYAIQSCPVPDRVPYGGEPADMEDVLAMAISAELIEFALRHAPPRQVFSEKGRRHIIRIAYCVACAYN